MDKIKALLAFLDGKKTNVAGTLITAAVWLYPPARQVFHEYPDLAPTVVALLMMGLRAVATKPGVIAQVSKKF